MARIFDIDTPPENIPDKPKKNSFGWRIPSQQELRPVEGFATEPEPAERDWGTVGLDSVKSFAKGAGTLTKSSGWLTGNETLEEIGRDAEAYWSESQSADLKSKLAKVEQAEGFIGKLSAFAENPAAMGDAIVQSIPMMIPGMGVGALSTRAVGAVAHRLALRAGASAEVAAAAAQKAALRTAIATNVTGEGAVSGGATGSEVESFAKAKGATTEEAKRMANEAALKAGLWTAAGAMVGAGMESRAMLGQMTDKGVKGLAKNTAKEAGEEMLQNPGENYAAYEQKVKLDPTQKFDLGGSMAEGLVTGGPMGAGFHVAGALGSRGEAATEAPPPGDDPAQLTPVQPEHPSTPPAPPPVDTNPDLQMQNRDRGTAASVVQVKSIANAPDFDRLGASPIADVGAPLVSIKDNADGALDQGDIGTGGTITLPDGAKVDFRYAVVDANAVLASHDATGRGNPDYGNPQPGQIVALTNGRMAGLQEAYKIGTASQPGGYMDRLMEDAATFGIQVESITGKEAPVLVRLYDDAVNARPDIGKMSNAGGSMRMSAQEVARNDARILPDVSSLVIGENGDLESPENQPFLRGFVHALPANERSEVLDREGRLSQVGMRRIRNAIIHRAYGESSVFGRLVESLDSGMANLSKALVRAAPKVARVKDLMAAGAARDMDVTATLIKAVAEIETMRKNGLSMADFLAQARMFDQLSPELVEVLAFLDANLRSPNRIAAFIELYYQKIEALGDPRTLDMFGAPQISSANVLKMAATAATREVQDDGVNEAGAGLGGGTGSGEILTANASGTPGGETTPRLPGADQLGAGVVEQTEGAQGGGGVTARELGAGAQVRTDEPVGEQGGEAGSAEPAGGEDRGKTAVAKKPAETKSTGKKIIEELKAKKKRKKKSEIDAAAHEAATSHKNDLPAPTPAQKEANNYRHGHITLHGLDISIENPAGSERIAVDGSWRVTMPVHYGYIKRTEGADGDHVDVFVGPNPEQERAWIINQREPLDAEPNASDAKFDEHKVMLGFKTADEAIAAYFKSFAGKFGRKVFQSVSPSMDIDGLKMALPKLKKSRSVKTDTQSIHNSQPAKDDLGAMFDEILAEETAPKKVGLGDRALATVLAQSSNESDVAAAQAEIDRRQAAVPIAESPSPAQEGSDAGVVPGPAGAAPDQSPSLADLNSGKAFVDSTKQKIAEWVAQATNNGARTMDRNWERAAVKRFVEANVKPMLDGKQTGSRAAAKIAVAKSETFADLESAIEKFAEPIAPADTDPMTAFADAQLKAARDLKAALAPVSSRAGQMNLANRGSRIATLKMMNEQIRKLDPTEAWHDSNIEDAQDLDALQDSISQTLVDLQRAKVASEGGNPATTKEVGAGEVRTYDAANLAEPGERTAGEAAVSAAKNTAAGLSDAIDGLGKLFGGPGTLGMGPVFNEDTYAKAKPLFQQAIAHFKDAGTDIKEAMRAVVRLVMEKFGPQATENMKPYIIRFAEDVRDGNIVSEPVENKQELEAENVYDKRSGTDLERDSEDADPEDAMGAPDVQDDREPDGGSGERGIPVAETASGERGGDGLRGRETATAGERGDQSIYTGTGRPGSAASAAGSDFDSGSDSAGLDGAPIEPEAADFFGELAESGLSLDAAKIRQLKADKAEHKPGLANIRETLPILTEGQQEDVHIAETRFAKPDGYGMLFTNGTGTGKTFSALGIIKRFDVAGKSNVIIAVPNDKISDDWQKAGRLLGLNISRLNDTKDAGRGIVITTYANFGQNPSLASREWDLIVADEAHYLAQDKDGSPTLAQKALQAISMHPQGVIARHAMLYREDIAKMKDIQIRLEDNIEQGKRNATPDIEAENDLLVAALEAAMQRDRTTRKLVDEDVASHTGAARPRVLFLSATPFAYEKSVDWANGYLFDYNEGQPENSNRDYYNSGSPRERFFMQHFGYRMRYNKLTEPDSRVDRGLMQRQFNSLLKKRGALAGRMLDVKADYDRRFILTESAIGTRIDQALEWFETQRKAQNLGDGDAGERMVSIIARADPRKVALAKLRDQIAEKFDYLSRRYLLEAIKAQEVIPHVREHLALGRKVVVFHDYKKGGGFNPFRINLISGNAETKEAQEENEAYNRVVDEFTTEFADLIESDVWKASSPITAFKKAFPNVILFNGDVPKAQRRANVEKFQDDASGPQVILVQSAAGKEGISLHDTTGKHQRVLFNLGQPTQPTTAIQQEGRIYRTGQATDAIFRYLNTGTDWEKWAFATTIAQRASAAENLGMGESARALKDAFIAGFEESDDYRAGMDGEGKGGKERDKAANAALTEYDRAKAFYFSTQKKNSKTKAREGVDYFATPEPVGLKMMELADIRPGESVLEPSAGHGAIARWAPETAVKTAIEPSMALRPRLAMVFDGKILGHNFEDLNIVNKYDAVVMNPPFGSGGKTAIDHVAKAAQHLRDGGRIVALIPRGPAADKKFDKWFYEESEKPAKPLYTHPELGPIYENDTVTIEAFGSTMKIAGPLSIDGSGSGPYFVRPKGENKASGTNLIALKEIQPGKRTNTYKAAEGLHLVANIDLPMVTFERAGTQVSTRIVVIEKSTDAPQKSNRDYSNVTDINDLFDRMENLSIAPRAKLVKADEPAAKPGNAKVEVDHEAAQAAADAAGLEIVEHVTQKGKTLRGVVRTDLTRDQAKKIDAFTFKKGGGWFIREKHLALPKLDGETRFSRSNRGGVHAEDMVAAVKALRAAFPGLQFHPLEQESHAPDELLNAIKAAGGDVAAAMHKGEVYLFAPSLKDASDVLNRGLHEAVHVGLARMFGTALDPLLLDIHRSNVKVQLRAARIKAKYGYSPVRSVEEVLADMGPEAKGLKGWQKLVAWVRSKLRAAGLVNEWRDSDIEALVLRALAAAKKPADTHIARGSVFAEKPVTIDEKPKFSRTEQPEPEPSSIDIRNATLQRVEEILRRKASGETIIDTMIRVPMQAVGIDKVTRLGGKVVRKIIDVAPESIKAGMVSDYGNPDDAINHRDAMFGHQRRRLRGVAELMERMAVMSREESRVAYEWLNNRNADELLESLPEKSRADMIEIKQQIDDIGKEAVDLGLLSVDAYEAHKGAYVHRSYRKWDIDSTKGERTSREYTKQILGEQFKTRGLTELVPMVRVQNTNPTFWKRKIKTGTADHGLRGEQFIRFERHKKAVGTASLPGVEGAEQAGKVVEVQYWPASEPVPARYGAWHQAGTFTVRGTKGDKLIMHRDWTKSEREKMGEIEDARYAIAKTFHQMIHDIEVAKYLQWIAGHYGKEVPPRGVIPVKASESMRNVFGKDDWVQVPNSTVGDTTIKRYGKLSGLYIPGPIWNDIRQVANHNYQPFGETYANILKAWKLSKTALSPGVHTNNIMSNFVMADWHDVRAGDVLEALHIIVRQKDPANKELLGRFEDSGGTIGMYTLSEIKRDQLEPLIEQLRADVAKVGELHGMVGAGAALQSLLHGRMKEAYEIARSTKSGRMSATVVKKMMDIYEDEDTVFRLAAFIKAKRNGATDLEAGKVARRSFLDYHINAPWIQAMRQTAFPFISFTYRAVPMLLEIIETKPWKIAKLAAFAGLLNALGYALSGGDEDKERRYLPNEKSGRVWGIVPKLIRTPWNDANDSPVFLDIRRWIPVGDVLDTGQSHAALPLIPVVIPGGPVALLAELLANKSQFTGKEITKRTDTAGEKTAAVIEHLFKAFAPNLFFLPGTYAATSVVNAGTGRTDVFGREQSVGMALASGVGIKLAAYPTDVLQRNAMLELKGQLREINDNMYGLSRERAVGGLSDADFSRNIQRESEKRKRLVEEFQRR